MITALLLKIHFKIIYFFMKFKKTKNKICFFTRQSDTLPLDFKLIIDEIKNQDKNVEIETICQRATINFKEIIKMYPTTIKQMSLLAESKAVIIDGYCLPVSILKHKKDLYVLQLWHSIGKIKKSSYQTYKNQPLWQRSLGKLMNLHQNYDNVIAAGSKFNKYYCECFKINEKMILNYGLPRIDYLIYNQDKIKNEILNKYKQFKDKKIILYAPTFRNYENNEYLNLYNIVDNNTILIVKNHPRQKLIINDKIYTCDEYTATDLISIADYVITDYSSISLEAAILNKKLIYYLYDYNDYKEITGLNVDPYKCMKNNSFFNTNELIKTIKNNEYDYNEYNKFKKNYLPNNLGNSTKLIANKILNEIRSDKNV